MAFCSVCCLRGMNKHSFFSPNGPLTKVHHASITTTVQPSLGNFLPPTRIIALMQEHASPIHRVMPFMPFPMTWWYGYNGSIGRSSGNHSQTVCDQQFRVSATRSLAGSRQPGHPPANGAFMAQGSLSRPFFSGSSQAVVPTNLNDGEQSNIEGSKKVKT